MVKSGNNQDTKTLKGQKRTTTKKVDKKRQQITMAKTFKCWGMVWDPANLV